MERKWQGRWITDGAYHFKDKHVSPHPMTFRKTIPMQPDIKEIHIYSTAMGIYEIFCNGKRLSDDYFAPGFTSYKKRLQYQTYEVKPQGHTLEICVVVCGGWAVGSYTYGRMNRITAKRQALLLDVEIQYENGTKALVGTDTSWEVTMDGACQMADFYDGEIYDGSYDPQKAEWHKASMEKLSVSPRIIAQEGPSVMTHEHLKPVSMHFDKQKRMVYDFGQNFAGVVSVRIHGRAGQKVTIRHAEICKPDGSLHTEFLRSAKATITYICRDGIQDYTPLFTYMGFRFIDVSGIDAEHIEVSAYALYSDMEQTGKFVCSDHNLNQLQSNILWSTKSNFVAIPTDCPQRDERMGWTGDIAVFSSTACKNFAAQDFLRQWLYDLRLEQSLTGGIPNTIPAQGFGFPLTMPTIAVDFWGDAALMVPWAIYQSSGDLDILEEMYPTMKKYVNACRFWAGIGLGDRHYIWHTLSSLHFGDWVTPDLPRMQQWQRRHPVTATASLYHTSSMLSRIAGLLGKKEDETFYAKYAKRVAQAYIHVFMEPDGRLKEEFQTAYVLPLYFGMLEGEQKKNAAAYLAALVKKNDYCIGTGFPGTPYILFALADNGYLDEAYRMLQNTKCPSWLYEVKVGATTIWERWDGLNENGECLISEDGTADVMISYNHYASGAVGDFFYRRILGVEPLCGGYQKVCIAPMPGGSLTWARGKVTTPYGLLTTGWKWEEDMFSFYCEIPIGIHAVVRMPNGEEQELDSGTYKKEMIWIRKKNEEDIA